MTKRKSTPQTMDDVVAQMADQMAEYQKVLDDNIAKYDALVSQAQSEIAALVTKATPTAPKPEAEWTEANGNQFLVLNVAAADFFTAIFEQVGVLATELGKMANQKGK